MECVCVCVCVCRGQMMSRHLWFWELCGGWEGPGAGDAGARMVRTEAGTSPLFCREKVSWGVYCPCVFPNSPLSLGPTWPGHWEDLGPNHVGGSSCWGDRLTRWYLCLNRFPPPPPPSLHGNSSICTLLSAYWVPGSVPNTFYTGSCSGNPGYIAGGVYSFTDYFSQQIFTKYL